MTSQPLSTKYLCDTNVISELVRRQPDTRVVDWISSLTDMAVSAVTVHEIYYGLAWKPRPRIAAWVDDFLREHCIVLPITTEIARHSGLLRGQMQSRGETRSWADMLIAATAQHYQLILATRNVRDFQSCGIPLLNPFSQH